jgi:curli biogenesis system outer membrane secretion channel CsgG
MVFMAGCASMPMGVAPPVSSEEPQYKISHKGPKKRVGIVEFENKTAYGQKKLGSSASDILATELFKTGAFIIVERERLNKVLEEQKMGASGAINPATAAQTGKVLGLNAIVTGSISEFGVKTEGVDYGIYKKKVQMADCSVDIRVVDSTTGQFLFAETGKGHFEREKKQVLGMGQKGGYDETLGTKVLRAAIVKFMDNLIQQLQTIEWTGRVASISGDKIYINAGRSIGLKAGDKLKVVELGEEIFDPETHVSLGRAEGGAKGTLTVTGFSGDKLTVASPDNGVGTIKVGDIVKYIDN